MPQDFLANLWSIVLMPERGWRERLAKVLDKDALKARGLSRRKVAKDAGLHHSQLKNILEGQDPSIENLEAICRAAQSSLGYVLFGWSDDAQAEAILRGLAEMDEDQREALLRLIPSLRSSR